MLLPEVGYLPVLPRTDLEVSETKLLNFKATPLEMERWAEVARSLRKSRSAWMRDVLNAAASGIPEHKFLPTPVILEPSRAVVVAEELKERAVQRAASKKTECVNRVPKGTFCKRCGSIHVR